MSPLQIEGLALIACTVGGALCWFADEKLAAGLAAFIKRHFKTRGNHD